MKHLFEAWKNVQERIQQAQVFFCFWVMAGFLLVMLKEKYFVLILAFPGARSDLEASIALSRLTGMSFTTWHVIAVEE